MWVGWFVGRAWDFGGWLLVNSGLAGKMGEVGCADCPWTDTDSCRLLVSCALTYASKSLQFEGPTAPFRVWWHGLLDTATVHRGLNARCYRRSSHSLHLQTSLRLLVPCFPPFPPVDGLMGWNANVVAQLRFESYSVG